MRMITGCIRSGRFLCAQVAGWGLRFFLISSLVAGFACPADAGVAAIAVHESKNSLGIPLINNQGQVLFGRYERKEHTGGLVKGIYLYLPDEDRTVPIAVDGNTIPGTDHVFDMSGWHQYALNNRGQVVFIADRRFAGERFPYGSESIYLADHADGSLQVYGMPGDSIFNETNEIVWFNSYSNISFNDRGDVLAEFIVRDTTIDPDKDHYGSDSTFDVLARINADTQEFEEIARTIPWTEDIDERAERGELVGQFSSFDYSSMNANGDVVYNVWEYQEAGGYPVEAVYVNRRGVTSLIAKPGQPSLDGSGVLEAAGYSWLNDDGDVLFDVRVKGEDGPSISSLDDYRLYLDKQGVQTEIAPFDIDEPSSKWDTIYSNGSFSNNSGHVVFNAAFYRDGERLRDEQGIYISKDGQLTEVVQWTFPVPEMFGVYHSVFLRAFNDAGQVVFTHKATEVLQPEPGSEDEHSCITERLFTNLYIGDGVEVLPVAVRGDSLAGSTIAFARMNFDWSSTSVGGLNELGQVAFIASLEDGRNGVFVYTPDLHWRGTAGDGAWDSRLNWTLSTQPAHVHELTINADGPVTVAGPTTDQTVKRLSIGGLTSMAKLVIGSGAIKATESVDVLDHGVLAGSGVIDGDVTFSPGSVFAPRVGASGFFDQVHITGSVALEGTLDIDTSNLKAALVLGDLYPVLSFAERGDTMFTAIEGAILDDEYALVVQVSDVELSLRVSVIGDINFDNHVNESDLLAIARNLDVTPDLYDPVTGLSGWQFGDFDADGVVSSQDVRMLLKNYGFSPDTGASDSSTLSSDILILAGIDPSMVPEPGSGFIALVGAGVGLQYRRRRYR